MKFCLQDGAALVKGVAEKTEVYDAESLGSHETVAVQPESRDPNTDPASGAASADTGFSRETVVRDQEHDSESRSGMGFVTGFLAGVAILGFLAIAFLGVWFVPGMITGDVNSNVAVKKPESFSVSSESAASITASSVRKSEKGNLYIPENIFDSDIKTAWCEGVRGTGKGEWVKIDFGQKLNLQLIEIKPGYFKNASVWRKNNRVSSVQIQFSDGKFRIFDFPDEMKTQRLELEDVETSFVKLMIKDIYKGSADQEDTLISEIGFTALK